MTKNAAEFFHTPDGQPYATVVIVGHRETMCLTSSACRDYLAREYFLATKQAATASALKDAFNVLCATAHTRTEHPVFPDSLERMMPSGSTSVVLSGPP